MGANCNTGTTCPHSSVTSSLTNTKKNTFHLVLCPICSPKVLDIMGWKYIIIIHGYRRHNWHLVSSNWSTRIWTKCAVTFAKPAPKMNIFDKSVPRFSQSAEKHMSRTPVFFNRLTKSQIIDWSKIYSWPIRNPESVSREMYLSMDWTREYLQKPVFWYKLRYIVGFLLVEMAISTNQKPTIYRNLYENTNGPWNVLVSCHIDIYLKLMGCKFLTGMGGHDWRERPPSIFRTPINSHEVISVR